MRVLNAVTGKTVNPGLIEHLNVKNVKSYVGCDRIMFTKLKTIHPFSIALLSAKKASYISMSFCEVYGGIGKDLATLQTDYLEVSGLNLKAEDVFELLKSETVYKLHLPAAPLLHATDEEIELIEDASNRFKGEIEWSVDDVEKYKTIKVKNPKLLLSMDCAVAHVFSSRGDVDRTTGQRVPMVEIVKAVETYPLVSSEVIAQTLVLSSLISLDATTEALKGYKVLMTVNLGGEESENTINKLAEVLSHIDELLDAPMAFSSSTFTDENVKATSPNMLNAFFLSKGCNLGLDMFITSESIDQSTFELLTNRTIRKLYANCEHLDVTVLGKKFKLLKCDDSCVTLREVKLKDKSQGCRIGEIIKEAVDICSNNRVQYPFEINLAYKEDEIEADSFVPILDAVNEINASRKAGKTKLVIGCTKLFSIKIPGKCYMNNKLIKTIKDFIKDNRSSAENFKQMAIDTGSSSAKLLNQESSYGPGGNYFCINLYA